MNSGHSQHRLRLRSRTRSRFNCLCALFDSSTSFLKHFRAQQNPARASSPCAHKRIPRQRRHNRPHSPVSPQTRFTNNTQLPFNYGQTQLRSISLKPLLFTLLAMPRTYLLSGAMRRFEHKMTYNQNVQMFRYTRIDNDDFPDYYNDLHLEGSDGYWWKKAPSTNESASGYN